MKDFFFAIDDFFTNVLFVPFHALKRLELDNWWAANTISWIFIVICIIAFGYWIVKLIEFDKNEKEDMSITSHSYL